MPFKNHTEGTNYTFLVINGLSIVDNNTTALKQNKDGGSEIANINQKVQITCHFL